jgi:hypothetical protein
MPFKLCPKCSTTMNEIKRQLIVPERLTGQPGAPASMQVLMECPNCLYTQQTPIGERLDVGHPGRREQ